MSPLLKETLETTNGQMVPAAIQAPTLLKRLEVIDGEPHEVRRFSNEAVQAMVERLMGEAKPGSVHVSLAVEVEPGVFRVAGVARIGEHLSVEGWYEDPEGPRNYKAGGEIRFEV